MKRPGFTLLELLIALSLFSIGMLTILEIFPVNRRFLTQSAQTTQASFLAQEEIESIRGLDYASLTVGTFEPTHTLGASTSDSLNTFSRQTTISYIDGNHQVTAINAGLKQVNVTVTWQERTINRQYLLSTYVYDK